MRTATLTLLLLVAAPTAAVASPATTHADVEIDPSAYLLDGNSIHVGLGRGHLRVDLGNFALALPQFVHGDDGFDVSFDGYGMKLQWFPFAEQRGLFVGIDGAVNRVLVRRQGSDLAARLHEGEIGVDVGYRIALPHGFYLTPWIGVGTFVGAKRVTLGGATYAPSLLEVFPTIHVGYRFF